MPLRTLLFSVLIAASAPSFAIYKCESGGKIGYSDSPCPNGRKLDVDSEPSADAPAAKEQARRDKAALRRIDAEKRKLEAQEEKEQRRAAHANAARQKKCKTLAMRSKWADEDAASATGKSAHKARLKANRIAEQLAMECDNKSRLEGA